MSDFSEVNRMMDVAFHLLKRLDIELVAYSGQIKDANPQWKHWATEMKHPGWYMLKRDNGKIVDVAWVTDSADRLLVYLFATTLIAADYVDRYSGG